MVRRTCFIILLYAGVSARVFGLDPCRVAYDAATGKTPLSGERLFDLAQDIKQITDPKQQATGGRQLFMDGVPEVAREEILQDLITEFQMVYRLKGKYEIPAENEKNSPLAAPNVPHIEDHLKMLDAFAGDLAREFGIDPLSMRVVVLAHDLGKARLNSLLDGYIAEKLKAAAGDAPGNGAPGPQFVKQFVMGHDEHTLAHTLPIAIGEVAAKHDLSPEQAADLFRQIAYNIVRHNFGPTHVDPSVPASEARSRLAMRYPELSEQEIEMVRDAFWVKFWGNGIRVPVEDPKTGKDHTVIVTPFAHDLDIDPVYGQPNGAMGNALALFDRITLVTDSAMEKIPKQNIALTGFNQKLIDKSFLSNDGVGVSTGALVKAQYRELSEFALGELPPATEFGPTAYGLAIAERATELGRRLAEMNTPERHTEMKLTPEETRTALLYTDKGGATYKIVGGHWEQRDNKEVFVESERAEVTVWDPTTTQWKPLPAEPRQTTTAKPGERRGWDYVLDFARADGFRIPTPEQWMLDRIRTP